MKRFQILSLIGGGIRGAFITSYLRELEQKFGKPISESFDLIAGTSTGGIIAAGLALGMSAESMHDFYVRYGAKIFSPRPKYRAKGMMRFVFPAANWVFKKRTGSGLESAFRARFCPDTLQAAFDEGFGEKTMRSVGFTRLIIPSVNLTKGTPHVFRSAHLPVGAADMNHKISDVVIAATAAPTYFPHRQIGDCAYVDGGVWAADPSMLAIAEAMRIQQYELKLKHPSSCELGNVHLLSVGTGTADFSLSPPGPDAGLLYWATRVADVMSMSQVHGIHQPLSFLLGNRYLHINFKMKEKWPLDGVEYIPRLFAVGKRRAAESYDEIERKFLHHRRSNFLPIQPASDSSSIQSQSQVALSTFPNTPGDRSNVNNECG